MANVDNILKGLQTAVNAIDTLMPAAEALGLPDIISKVSGVISSTVDVAINVKQRIDEGKIVVANEDRDEIEAIIGRLTIANDELAKRIADS